jgi:imidazolonepropionase-like amidohydrolase
MSHRASALPTPITNIVLKNVNVFDGLATHSKAHIWVKGNKFAYVGSDSSLLPPTAETEFDFSDRPEVWVLPGLVEGHAHITFNDSFDFDIPVEEHTLITARNAKKLLMAGFTSAFSAASAKIRLEVAVRDAINAGHLDGPRLLAASPEITATGGLGYGRVRGLHESDCFGYPADGPEEIRKAIRLMASQGVDNIKINISGEEYTDQEFSDVRSTYSREEVRMAVQESKRWGKTIAAHCRGRESVTLAVEEGIDVIYHLDYADEAAIEAILETKPFLGPAVGFLHADNDPKLEVVSKLYQTIRERSGAKAKVVIGGDYGFPVTPQGKNARDLRLFRDLFGYSNTEALTCGTYIGGQLMGMQVGFIAENYLADFLIISGDPTQDVSILEDSEKLLAIYQNGICKKLELRK